MNMSDGLQGLLYHGEVHSLIQWLQSSSEMVTCTCVEVACAPNGAPPAWLEQWTVRAGCRFNSSARNIKGGGEEKKTIIVQIYLNTRSLSLYHRADRVAAFFVAFQTDLARR